MSEFLKQLATLGVGAAALAAFLVLLCVLVLPKKQRYRSRLPAAMLGIFALAAVVHAITPSDQVAHEAFGIIGLFFLMLSLARSTFLILYHGIVVRSVGREAPRILGDLVQGLFFAAALSVVFRAMGVELGSLLGASALLTAVIGFALQDTLGNLFSGLAMQMQSPFELGDFISYDTDEQHIGEAEFGCATASGDVTHATQSPMTRSSPPTLRTTSRPRSSRTVACTSDSCAE